MKNSIILVLAATFLLARGKINPHYSKILTVEWFYTYTPLGRVASGYVIKKCDETKINQGRLGSIKL